MLQTSFEGTLAADFAVREEFLQLIDDEPGVAIYVPTNCQNGDSPILDSEFLQYGPWKAMKDGAVEVFQPLQTHHPVHLSPEDGDVIGEQDHWWRHDCN